MSDDVPWPSLQQVEDDLYASGKRAVNPIPYQAFRLSKRQDSSYTGNRSRGNRAARRR
jgi:hypothetical protein